MSIAAENGFLWLPPDLSDLLTVSVDADADDSYFEAMQTINAAASLWLSGEMDDYTYFELLDHYGINPYGFVGEVEEHLAMIMR